MMEERIFETGPYNGLTEEMRISRIAENYLSTISKWSKFIAIMGFIGAGFIALMALTAKSWTSMLTTDNGADMIQGYGSGTLMITYLLMALIQFFISLYLFRFAQKTKQSLATHDTALITDAFNQLKGYFQINGILMIIALVFIVIAIVIGIAAGIGAASV